MPAHAVVDGLAFAVFLFPGIGQVVDNLGGTELGPAVTAEHKDAEKSQWQVMKLEQQQEIAYQSDDTVASDVGILHDGKSPFSGGTATETVEKVRQSVFVQATGDKQACDEGKNPCQ